VGATHLFFFLLPPIRNAWLMWAFFMFWQANRRHSFLFLFFQATECRSPAFLDRASVLGFKPLFLFFLIAAVVFGTRFFPPFFFFLISMFLSFLESIFSGKEGLGPIFLLFVGTKGEGSAPNRSEGRDFFFFFFFFFFFSEVCSQKAPFFSRIL